MKVHLDTDIGGAASRLGTLMARQAEAYERLYGNTELGRAHALLPDDLLNFQHDGLACAVALGWAGARIEELPLRLGLENGYPVLRSTPDGSPRRIVTEMDGERFARLWLDVVTRDIRPA